MNKKFSIFSIALFVALIPLRGQANLEKERLKALMKKNAEDFEKSKIASVEKEAKKEIEEAVNVTPKSTPAISRRKSHAQRALPQGKKNEDHELKQSVAGALAVLVSIGKSIGISYLLPIIAKTLPDPLNKQAAEILNDPSLLKTLLINPAASSIADSSVSGFFSLLRKLSPDTAKKIGLGLFGSEDPSVIASGVNMGLGNAISSGLSGVSKMTPLALSLLNAIFGYGKAYLTDSAVTGILTLLGGPFALAIPVYNGYRLLSAGSGLSDYAASLIPIPGVGYVAQTFLGKMAAAGLLNTIEDYTLGTLVTLLKKVAPEKVQKITGIIFDNIKKLPQHVYNAAAAGADYVWKGAKGIANYAAQGAQGVANYAVTGAKAIKGGAEAAIGGIASLPKSAINKLSGAANALWNR